MSIEKLSVENNNYARAKSFVNADDAKLKHVAYKKAYNPEDKYRQRKIIRNGMALTLAGFVASSAALTPVSKGHVLSGKLGAAVKSAIGLGFSITTFLAGAAVLGSAVKNSSSLQDTRKKHPFMTVLTEIGLIFVGMHGCEVGAGKLGKKLIKKFPSSANSIADTVLKVEKDLDKTGINKNLSKKYAGLIELATKHPRTAINIMKLIRFSPFIVMGSAIGMAASNDAKRMHRAKENYANLKTAQNSVAKEMIKNLENKNEALANVATTEHAKNIEYKEKLETIKERNHEQHLHMNKSEHNVE